jgi:quercetin 2,3-dioxygenase
MRKVIGVFSSDAPHWVGDGFPVRTLISAAMDGEKLSPFLLLDYAGPYEFKPTQERHGVGEHPHRGFETVTIIYEGELEHRDSAGNGGRIGAGDVQWMTAASGVLHEEFHSRDFARAGGVFEVVQLWVNLPAKDKGAKPAYQTLRDGDIPRVDLPHAAGVLRVIAGDYDGARGPARTFTPINLFDLRLHAERGTSLTLPEGHMLGLAVLRGEVVVDGAELAGPAQFVLLDRSGGAATLAAKSEASVLVLSGAPIEEPVVMRGPFVMNTQDEILQAVADFNSGRFGRIAAA